MIASLSLVFDVCFWPPQSVSPPSITECGGPEGVAEFGLGNAGFRKGWAGFMANNWNDFEHCICRSNVLGIPRERLDVADRTWRGEPASDRCTCMYGYGLGQSCSCCATLKLQRKGNLKKKRPARDHVLSQRWCYSTPSLHGNRSILTAQAPPPGLTR